VTAAWLGVADDDRYGIDNLPYGFAELPDGRHSLVVRVGDAAVDVSAMMAGTLLEPVTRSLDTLLAAGPDTWAALRRDLTTRLGEPPWRHAVEPFLLRLGELRLRLPFTVADYVDFYASEHHASAAGALVRPGGDPLTPNWKHLPLGYHGRAGTVVVSGTPVRRPRGQYRDGDDLVHAATARLDFEAEVACIVGAPSPPQRPVSITEFDQHVFGICLLNDWSARDLQRWEGQPLGPLSGKAFATSVSAWVTPLAALAGAWVAPGPRQPVPLPYLDDSAAPTALDLALEVSVNGSVLARPPFAAMYWTLPQLIAQLTVSGAALRTGDLVASGTVSGPAADERGCLLELTRDGNLPLGELAGNGYLSDGDEVRITATAAGPRGRIALGEVVGRIQPAVDDREPNG
jgi:fumarylacetoacetase